MRLFKHTIWIARPRGQVFDFFVDFSRSHLWRQYVTSMRVLDDGPLKAGSRLEVNLDMMGTAHTYEMTVVACEPPALWRHRTSESDFNGYVEYAFEPEGEGTRVTMSMHAKPASFLGWLAMPLLFFRGGRAYEDQLPRLKGVLEGGRGIEDGIALGKQS